MKFFSYTRYGAFELGRSGTGYHLSITQADGRTATYWATDEEIAHLRGLLARLQLKEAHHG